MLDSKVTSTLESILDKAGKAFNAAASSADLYQQKVQFLGKQGELSLVMREMGSLPADQKPLFGKKVNEVKAQLEEIYARAENQLKGKEILAKLESDKIDITLPGVHRAQGSFHPVQMVMKEIIDILAKLGFTVRTGPWIEEDFNNFTALNMPKDHPARDMQDTFYIDSETVLRTHTSPIQIRTMKSEKPPIRILAPGATFRRDSDISHSPHFHQIEGLVIDKHVSMAHLKGVIGFFVNEFFGAGLKTRFRPSFFPFTEPSAEVDCQCPICLGKGSTAQGACRMCKSSGWVEIGGCGLVHPNVLQATGIDSKEWQGLAWGFGIERMAIIKYGISDIRLFSQNDIRFLEQFL